MSNNPLLKDFYDAVIAKDVEKVRKCLKNEQNKVNVNSILEEGKTALDLSIEENDWDMFICLIEEFQINVKSLDLSGTNALIRCANYGRFAMAKYLLEHFKFDVNMRNRVKATALSCACRKGDFETAQLLVETYQADTHVNDAYGRTPLHIVCITGHLRIAEMLLEKGKADVNVKEGGNGYDFNPLCFAIANGHYALVRMLVEKFHASLSSESDQDENLFNLAAYSGYIEIAKYLRWKGARVNEFDRSLMHPIDEATRKLVIDYIAREEMRNILLMLVNQCYLRSSRSTPPSRALSKIAQLDKGMFKLLFAVLYGRYVGTQ
jgi:ankyrin repeat protein